MGGDRYLQTHYERPGYQLYDGNKPILVGHKNYTGTDQPFVYLDRVFGLDTNCVTGKALTGILLPSFLFVSVPSRANYWMQVRRQYPQPPKPAHPRHIPVAWNEDEDKLLVILIENLYRASAVLLRDLRSEPGFVEMSPRAQAKIFSKRVADNSLVTLLQLARLGRLDIQLAHKILKTPVALDSMVERVREIK